MKKTPKGYRVCIGCLNILEGSAPIITGSGVSHLETTEWHRIDGGAVKSIWIKYCFVCGKEMKGKSLKECLLDDCHNKFVISSSGRKRKYCCTTHRARAWQRRKAEGVQG